ncbi:MAG: hypothetical protein IJ619_08200 [Eubacterium sp.]|nr:hypothetical protein [Eubacterium sp.]
MTNTRAETISLLEMLPEDDISLINIMIKKLIKAWDPDFTKLTPTEATELEKIIAEMDAGEYVTDDDIEW